MRIGPGQPHTGRIAVALALIGFGSIALTFAWVHLLLLTGISFPSGVSELLGRVATGGFGAIAVLVLLGPLVEEVLARGGLLRSLLWFYHPAIAVVASAATFAALHGNLHQLLPAFWLGIVLGGVFARTGSIALCVWGHAFYNAQPVLANLFLPTAGAEPSWLVAARVVALVWGVFLLRRALSSIPVDQRPLWRPRPKGATIVPVGLES